MRRMGLETVYCRPRTSQPEPGHRVYPYLLRNLAIERPQQVWCADITYLPLQGGFVYLVAVMDWFSRAVLSWELSNTLDTEFCLLALEEALEQFGVPEIFNTDQGSQFTAEAFTGCLQQAGVRVSMDGRGRWMDNVFIERLWRSLKYEAVYLQELADGFAARARVAEWLAFYNHVRPTRRWEGGRRGRHCKREGGRMKPKIRLKRDQRGWFAAGAGFERALGELSDAAFKVFAHVCLTAARADGSLEFERDGLAKQLGKSRSTLGRCLRELVAKQVCEWEAAPNQYRRSRLRVCPQYWPYEVVAQTVGQQAAPQSPSVDASAYVAEVRKMFRAPACVQGRFGSDDERLAADWQRAGVSLATVQRAILLGSVRKSMSLLDQPGVLASMLICTFSTSQNCTLFIGG